MPNSDTEEWSAEAGANFHGCLKKSNCRAKFPEFTDCWDSCGPPVLNVSYRVESQLSFISHFSLVHVMKKYLLLYIHIYILIK